MSRFTYESSNKINVDTTFEIPNLNLWGNRALGLAENLSVDELTNSEILALVEIFGIMQMAAYEGLPRLFAEADRRELSGPTIECYKGFASELQPSRVQPACMAVNL